VHGVEPANQVELLEDQRDLAPCDAYLPSGRSTDIAPIDPGATGVRRGESSEATEQGRLPRAARAEHRHDLARLHRERDARECPHAVRIRLGDALDPDHRLHHRR